MLPFSMSAYRPFDVECVFMRAAKFLSDSTGDRIASGALGAASSGLPVPVCSLTARLDCSHENVESTSDMCQAAAIRGQGTGTGHRRPAMPHGVA